MIENPYFIKREITLGYDKIYSVSDYLRFNSRKVTVLGTITSLSRLYKMISSAEYCCNDYGFHEVVFYAQPNDAIEDRNKKQSSRKCKCDVPILPTFDHVNAVTIELQDLDDLKDTENYLVYCLRELPRYNHIIALLSDRISQFISDLQHLKGTSCKDNELRM